MFKFAHKNIVADSVECFLEVYKDFNCRIIKCISYIVCDVDKCMSSGIFVPKAILVFIDTLLFFEKSINPLKDKFSKFLLVLDSIEIGR